MERHRLAHVDGGITGPVHPAAGLAGAAQGPCVGDGEPHQGKADDAGRLEGAGDGHLHHPAGREGVEDGGRVGVERAEALRRQARRSRGVHLRSRIRALRQRGVAATRAARRARAGPQPRDAPSEDPGATNHSARCSRKCDPPSWRAAKRSVRNRSRPAGLSASSSSRPSPSSWALPSAWPSPSPSSPPASSSW